MLKNAGFLAKTNHPKTRIGYNTTHLSEYWGFLHSEPIHETLDEDHYFVGTMGLIVDYSHSDEKYGEEIVSFLVENKSDIYCHTSLKNPERLFHNMIQAHGMIRDRHIIRPDSDSTQSSFCFDSYIFKKL